MLSINSMDTKSQAEKGLNLNLHRLSFLVDSISKETIAKSKINLTNSQYLVLKSILILEESSQKEISDFLKITQAAISRHIYNLHKMGLIKITDETKRSHLISLTSDGIKTLEKAMIAIQDELKKRIPDYNQLSKSLNSTIQKICN